MSNSWILVTGGAGFIGSHLVDALVAAGKKVRVLDDFSTGLASHLPPGVEMIPGSVTVPATVEAAMDGVDTVFHLAALASVQRSVEAPAESHDVCATGTLRVLDTARRHGVRRVVYAASASAYGIPNNEVQRESDPLVPLSPYAAAKLSGEVYCQAFAATYGLETVRLRFFNIFGPRQRADSPYSGVIAIFAGLLAAGKTPTIFGDGQQTRDFTYVSDVVQALQKAAEVPGISGEVFNVGTGKPTTLLELVAGLNAILGTALVARHAEPRIGDIRHSCANIQRTQERLGYTPEVDFQEGLRRTMHWAMQQSNR
jgi:UDP-glucose 4-epimerase